MEFDIPLKLADLETPQREGALGPKAHVDVAGMSDAEANDLVEQTAYDLCENDALCVLEQDVFDRAYACARDFAALKPIGRIRITDALCSNLSVLSASVASLLASGAGDAADATDVVASHREALKAYACLVHHIADVADAEARATAGVAAATSAPGAGKADKKAAKKTKGAPLVEWKWEEQRERVMHVMAGVLDADLWNLFRPRQPSEAFLGLFTKLGCLALESQPALRSKITKGAAFSMLGACALKWGQLENVTTALVHLLNKHEHLPGPIAECAAVAADRFENARLAAALLREVASVDPAEYKRQQLSDAKGVSAVGVFVAELAQRMPKTTMTNISLLLPHLDGEAYSLRSALVTVLGHLVCSDASSGSLTEDRDRSTSDASTPLLRAKQGFLDLLVERVHDVSAFTRARVLQTWAAMAEKKAVPLSHWLVVADLAIGRLGDKSALVRKAAMHLLAVMLGFNPFAPQLPSSAFASSLKEYEAKLAQMAPPPRETPETVPEGDEANAERDAADEEKDASNDEEKKNASDDEEKNASEQEAPRQEPNGAAETAETAADPPPSTQPELDGGVEAVRTMVAALKTALGFAVQMSGAVHVLCRLLASSTPSDAIEATGLLVRLRQFGVDGADEGVRRMLGLVFSRDAAVRDAAVEAVDVLFLSGADSPVAAAAALAEVASASALGELAALEEVLKLLVADGRVPPDGAVVRAVWALATAREASDAARAAAFTVLAMAAATAPEVVVPHVDHAAAALERACRAGDGALARAAAALLARARPGGNAGTKESAGVASPALAPDGAAFAALAKVLSPGSALSGRAWYPAAEQSIAALYALHPDPEGAASDVIRSFAAAAFNPKKKDDDASQHAEDAEAENAEENATENDAENDAPKAKASAKTTASAVDAAQLSRFLFVLGEVGLRHLVHVEGLGRAVRRARVARDRAAAEASEAAAAAGKRGGEEAELAAALGQGAVGEDLELDNAREACEAELLAFESEARGRKQSGKGLVAAYAPVVVALCGHPAIAAGHPLLRGAALAALSRLMAIDGGFCEAHLALIFTRLRDESDKGTRAALMVALGDLAFRFPNAVEPWTEHLYGVREWGNSLHDPDSGVRQHAITVLAHLVLNDMMKVKGHIAEMARCLEDPDPRVAAVAKLLFAELSRKHGNPIYNLLPDLLSRLSGDAATSPEAFRAIMTRLLGFIDKDRQTEALADKFVHRFAEAALAPTPKPARDVAFCISALALSDRAFKKFMDAWKLYEPALYDREVFAHLDAVVAKAKKTYGGKKAFAKNACETDAAGDVSALEGPRKEIEDFERRMAAAHVERFESYRSARRAEGHAVDEDETPAVTLGGGEERSGKEGPECAAEPPDADGEAHPETSGGGAEAAEAAAAADDDAPSAPKALAEEEARAEAEAENDENAPGENAPDAGAPEENAPEENAPEPAPKRGRKPAAKKEKKAKPAAKKTQEETDAPVRSSRRALRAK